MTSKSEITIADVARAAGVSVSTVSRILNDRPDVSEATRRQVTKVIAELGFEPHAHARRLAAGQSRTIALLDPVNRSGGQPQQIDQLHLDFMVGAASAASEANYFFNVLTNFSGERKLLSLYRSAQVDGVLLMEVYQNDPRVALLRQQGFPFVMIGRCADDDELSYVELDLEGAAQLAFDHLVGLGHTRIGFIGFDADLQNQGYGPAVRAWAGYQAALAKHGLSPAHRETPYRAQDMGDATLSLLAERPDLTAIVGMADAAMIGVFNALRQSGRRIPEDISVVGLAVDRLAELMTPALTAIRFPSFEMGHEAAAVLIRQLQDEAAAPEQKLVPLEIVQRGSSGPAHQN